jgi:hypothetical protein
MSFADIGYVGYGEETTEGIIVSPTIFLPVSAFNFENTNEYITPDQIRGSRDRSITMPSAYAVSGTMDMELVPNGIRSLLKSASSYEGTITPSAYSGGGYQSVFIPGNATTPTFTFEASAADILVMRYGGVRINTLSINAAFNEIVTSSWGLEGTTREKQTGTSTESYDAVLPFHFTGASIKTDSTERTDVKNFTFTLGNNIERIGTLRKTRSWKRTALGMRDVGLSCTMDFVDDDDMDTFLAETEFSVELHLEGDYITGTSGPKYTLKIEIPRVRWNSLGLPLNANSYLEQALEALILRPLNGNPIFTMTLVNTESTAF